MTGNGLNVCDVEWEHFSDPAMGPLRWKTLLNDEICACSEFVVGYAELPPGATLPLHTRRQTEFNLIVKGRAWGRVGRNRVELEPMCGTYFQGQAPHSYEVIGKEPLGYYFIYATERYGQDLTATPISEEVANRLFWPNLSETRWAVAEDFEPWLPWEPSKGKRGLRWLNMFDRERGGHTEMMPGTSEIPPGGRYSRHYHAQPEIFICRGGRGTLYCGETRHKLWPGTAVYVPRNTVHGGQSYSSATLKMAWAYGTESAPSDWSWTPVEDIKIGAMPDEF